jgi:membrane protein GlpM
MSILAKSIIGGLVTALIAWLATKGNVLPGILPLFPTFGLIALYIVGSKGDAKGFQEACVAAIKTIPAYVAFLAICYWSVKKVNYRAALLLGLAGWFLVAWAILALAPGKGGR